MKKELSIYTPNYRHKLSIFGIIATIVKNIINSWELILVLFKRDFLMSYKKSFIGIGWILISPMIGIISWVFMNSTGVLNPGEVGIPYPAFVLLSSSIWGLFMGFYGSASSTLGAGSEFIMQVKYPHEVLLVKQIMVQVTNFAIAFGLNILVLLAFGVTPSWHIILFPILVLPLLFLGAAIGLILSVVAVVATDLNQIFSVLFSFVFYITPVIYTADEKNDLLQKVITYNPLTYLVGGVRDLIIYGEMDYPERFLFCAGLSFIFFILALRTFYVSEDRVVERMV